MKERRTLSSGAQIGIYRKSPPTVAVELWAGPGQLRQILKRRAPRLRRSLTASMSVDEAAFVPNIEPGADAWNVQAVGFSDCGLVRVFVDLNSIEHLTGVIDETDAVYGHDISARHVSHPFIPGVTDAYASPGSVLAFVDPRPFGFGRLV